MFDESYKNEIMPGIFRSDTALQKGIVKKMNPFNVTQAIVNVEENDIIIFPQKQFILHNLPKVMMKEYLYQQILCV